jgi:hypothetical protein
MVINTAFAGTIGWLRPGALHQHCPVDAADQAGGSGPWTAFRVWLSASRFRASESNSTDQGGCRFNLNLDLLMGTHVIHQAGGKL